MAYRAATAPTVVDAELTSRLRAGIGRLARRLNASADPGPGLTPTEMSVLGVLVRQGPLGLSDLAAIESVNPTMLSRVVAKLVSTDLVDRVPDPTNHRAVLVGATPAGRTVHARIRDERTAALTEALRRMPAAQVRSVLSSVPAFEALARELALVNSERRTQL
jgi:DNA-binding MarR family transcriptional regulator